MRLRARLTGGADVLLYSALSFALSVLSSAVCGRALWCDEILRIKGQGYSVADLLAFRHLHDFCTQTPSAYLFTRPLQKFCTIVCGDQASGFVLGGVVASALAAAVVTASVLYTARFLRGGKGVGILAALFVATNPLAIYYGGEVCFYSIWAGAFAAAFAFLVRYVEYSVAGDWKRCFLHGVALIVAASLFVTFHFAGIFIWIVPAAVACVAVAAGRRIADGIRTAIVVAIPVLVNLPMYLGAQDKAVHIGTQAVDWSRMAVIPSELLKYVCKIGPSLTGGFVVGVALFAVGAYAMAAKPRDAESAPLRRSCALAIASIFAVVLFLSYSSLRSYMPPVARYWVYACAPALLVCCFAAGASRRFALIATGVVLCCNVLANMALIASHGRMTPYKMFVDAVEKRPEICTVVYPNHYETRFFGGFYKLPNGVKSLVPSYWEQGEEVRQAGLVAIKAIFPMSAVYASSESDFDLAVKAGFPSTNVVVEQRGRFIGLAKKLRIYPEPGNFPEPPARLLLPDMAGAKAEADATGRPFLIPGDGMVAVSIPTRLSTSPFMPCAVVNDGTAGEASAYVPAKAEGSLTLNLTCDSNAASVRFTDGAGAVEVLRFPMAMGLVTYDLHFGKPGEFVKIKIEPQGGNCIVAGIVMKEKVK